MSLQTPLCPRLSKSSMRGRLRVPSVTHALHGILQKVELLAPTARIHRSVEIALKQGKQAELASWRRHQLSVLISAPHTGEWSRMRAAGLGVSVIVQHLERCLLVAGALVSRGFAYGLSAASSKVGAVRYGRMSAVRWRNFAALPPDRLTYLTSSVGCPCSLDRCSVWYSEKALLK